MERAQMDIVVGPNGMGRIGMEPRTYFPFAVGFLTVGCRVYYLIFTVGCRVFNTPPVGQVTAQQLPLSVFYVKLTLSLIGTLMSVCQSYLNS